MPDLFNAFPYLENETILIRKMTEEDLEDLIQITENEKVYRYIPLFLYKKSRGNLLAAIRNLGGRDFDKKKMIIAGIYLKGETEKLVGLAEMFDYRKRLNQITVGYRLNEDYWHRGIATAALGLMKEYLTQEMGVHTLLAYVMPENVASARVLLHNGFVRQPEQKEDHNWGGRETVTLDVYEYIKSR